MVRPAPPLAPKWLSQRIEFEFLAPRLVSLSDEQRQEAVGLLAELLLDAARKRAGVRSAGVFDGAFDGATGGVAPLPDQRAEARTAA